MIKHLEEKILKGGSVSKKDASDIVEISGSDVFNLFISANIIRNHSRGSKAELCSIVNAKSGACPEDCSFCAQSSKSKAEIKVYPLRSKEIVIQRAKEAKNSGIKRFSIVTSGRKVSTRDLLEIAGMISNQPVLNVIIITLKLQKGFSHRYA